MELLDDVNEIAEAVEALVGVAEAIAAPSSVDGTLGLLLPADAHPITLTFCHSQPLLSLSLMMVNRR